MQKNDLMKIRLVLACLVISASASTRPHGNGMDHGGGDVLSTLLKQRPSNQQALWNMEPNKRQRLTEEDGLTSADGEVVRWLKENGVQLDDLSWHRGRMGFSVRAARELKAGQIVATLPNELVLTCEAAWADTIGDAVKKASVQCSDEMMLWTYMALERNGDGKWGSYLAALPSTVSIPTTWEDHFLQTQLGGTSLYAQVQEERTTINQEFKSVCSALGGKKERDSITLGRILWAASMFRSRSFPSSLVEGGSRRPCMLPLLDMFNHRRGEPIEWCHGPAGIQFKIGSDKAKGDEIFNNYGARSNAELLFSYGFCTYPNPDDTVIVSLGCKLPSSTALAAKTAVLEGLGLPFTTKDANLSLSIGPFEICRDSNGGIPALLFTAMAVCMMEEDEEPGGEVEVTLDEVERILELVQAKLAAIPFSREEDRVVIEDEDGRAVGETTKEREESMRDVARYASMYRQGQRDVLEEAEATLKAMMSEGAEEDGEGGGGDAEERETEEGREGEGAEVDEGGQES